MDDFLILENWNWFSKSCWFWGYKSFCPIPWEFDFENFAEILKLRGLRPYAWAFFSQNHPMCISYYAGHFDMRNRGYLFDFTSTHAISTPVIFNFRSVFYSELFSAVSSTLKISIKMFQIQKGIFWEYFQNFPRLPIYGFAHAKVKKSIFISIILEFIGDIGIIFNDFQSWF